MNRTTAALHPNTSHLFQSAKNTLRRKCSCGNRISAGMQCTECAKRKHRLQRKLTIGASNDPLEREADQIAERVITADFTTYGTPLPVRRHTEQPTAHEGPAPASVEQVLASPGKTLEPKLREEMEPRFGHDFSQVRIHTGATAERSAREVNADAYTTGHNIVFGNSRFAPGTLDGRRLIAHELTHVVQQSETMGIHAIENSEKCNRSSTKHAVIRRRVAARLTNCPANTNSAPADPVGELRTIDGTAAALVNGTAILLSVASALTGAGFRNPASVVDRAYRNTFGLPSARPGGFMNRLTGTVRTTQDEALCEEMELLSRRFQLLGRFFNQFVPYRCGIPETFGGCTQTAADCATDDAGACAGVGAIFLCPGFWTYNRNQQAGILIHEAAHINWTRIVHGARGSGGNFRHAECYAEFVAQIFSIALPPTGRPCAPPGP